MRERRASVQRGLRRGAPVLCDGVDVQLDRPAGAESGRRMDRQPRFGAGVEVFFRRTGGPARTDPGACRRGYASNAGKPDEGCVGDAARWHGNCFAWAISTDNTLDEGQSKRVASSYLAAVPRSIRWSSAYGFVGFLNV